MTEHISKEVAFNAILKLTPKVDDDGYCWVIRGDAAMAIDSCPAADVRSAEDYNKLLKAAKAMHTWIFLNTGDEQAVYDECHLDDEMNALLGYGGSFEIRMREEKA